MRLAVVVALATACHASGECTHEKWSMPSQTAEGSGTMEIQTSGGKLGNITVPSTNQSIQMSLFHSFDYESMNMVMRQSQDMTIPEPQGQVKLHTEVGAILNWKSGLMTTRMKSSSMDGKVQDVCKTVQLPFFLRFIPIGKILEKIKDLEASFLKCVGHHDDLDKFAFSMEFPPKWVPKIVTGKMPRVNLSIDMDVDVAGLLKSYELVEDLSMEVKVNLNGKTETMHSNSHVQNGMSFSKSRAGGPTEGELKVPAEWGDCSTVHTPELEDLLAEWERSDSPFLGRTRIIPHTLRALMADGDLMARAQASTVVV